MGILCEGIGINTWPDQRIKILIGLTKTNQIDGYLEASNEAKKPLKLVNPGARPGSKPIAGSRKQVCGK
jgi:hypothetical protein